MTLKKYQTYTTALLFFVLTSGCNKRINEPTAALVDTVKVKNYIIGLSESSDNDTTTDIYTIDKFGKNRTKLSNYENVPFYQQYKYRMIYDLRFSRFDSSLLMYSMSYGSNVLGTNINSVDIYSKTSYGHGGINNADGSSSQAGGFWLTSSKKYPNEEYIFSTSFDVFSFVRDTREVKNLSGIRSNNTYQNTNLMLAPNKSTVYYLLIKPDTRTGLLKNDTVSLFKTTLSFTKIQLLQTWVRKNMYYFKYGPVVIEDIDQNGDLLLQKDGLQITDSMGNLKSIISQHSAIRLPRFIPGNTDSIMGVLDFSANNSGIFFLHKNQDSKRIVYQSKGPGRINGITIQ